MVKYTLEQIKQLPTDMDALSRLKDITEEEIDYSDIPKVTSEQINAI